MHGTGRDGGGRHGVGSRRRLASKISAAPTTTAAAAAAAVATAVAGGVAVRARGISSTGVSLAFADKAAGCPDLD